MATVSKPHVWYAGDWVFLMGPTFVETPFNTTETKDCELRFYGRRLAEALQPVAEVTCTANWDLYRMEPGKLEEYLQRSAVMIVSDVEAKCFHLYPAFFDRARLNKEVVTFPDRLVSLKNWVHDGGGLMMLGGWLSFRGPRRPAAGDARVWPRLCPSNACSAKTWSRVPPDSPPRCCYRTIRWPRACRGRRSRRFSATTSSSPNRTRKSSSE